MMFNIPADSLSNKPVQKFSFAPDGPRNDRDTFAFGGTKALPPPTDSLVFDPPPLIGYGMKENIFAMPKKPHTNVFSNENSYHASEKPVYGAGRSQKLFGKPIENVVPFGSRQPHGLHQDTLKDVQPNRSFSVFGGVQNGTAAVLTKKELAMKRTRDASVQTVGAGGATPRSGSEGDVEMETFEAGSWIALFCWEHPAHTLYRFAQGVVFLAGLWYAQYGGHNLNFVSGLACCASVNLAVNFLVSMASMKLQEQRLWVRSGFERKISNTLAELIKQVALFHDAYLSAREPVGTFTAVVALWALSNFGCWCSAWGIAAALFLLSFSLPPLLRANQRACRQCAAETAAMIKEKYEELGFTRKFKALVMVTLFVLMVNFLSWGNVAMSIFAMVAATRCMLKPAEVEAIRTAATPLAVGVSNTSRRLFDAANDCVERLTPARRTLGTTKLFKFS